MNPSRPLAFVSGPLGAQEFWLGNTQAACHVADVIWRRAGVVPFVPHLSSTWASLTVHGKERSYEEWMELCFTMLRRCDLLVRVEGESPGADRECVFAKVHGIPVYHVPRIVPGFDEDALHSTLSAILRDFP